MGPCEAPNRLRRARSASGPARVVYFGTPEVAVPPLQALYRSGHDIALVVTRPPKRRGRRQEPTPSPAAAAAAEMGLAVTSDLTDALHVEADLGVVVAYGERIPDEVLEGRRTVNLHFSLLPRWRGAAPVERAILAGDAETGVCLMDVASEIDAGDVYRRASTAIRPQESADELRGRLCELGIGLLMDALSEGFGDPVPQSGEMTWADKISGSELRIDWTVPADHVLRLVRVGGAWTMLRGRRLRVLEARLATGSGLPGAAGTICLGPRSGGSPAVDAAGGRSPAVDVFAGQGGIELVRVQLEGRAPIAARDWVNGARIADGDRFE
ncbi:MAG: methionyl-tRNA formyltransferase [Acidimicrobiaceae bacterium]|nr:methionyl-tRNA formyltransferase [Acidimicrobiaceae bacterium]MYK74659.1 methionyl-tRNA formyltransferase [Acidimicrobiaceae bacterium]